MQPVQGSVEAMQQSYLSDLQRYSLSGVSTISNSQQHMINVVKPGSRSDLGQGNSLNSPQQVATGSLQQNPVNSLQHDNISSFSAQGGMNSVQRQVQQLMKLQQMEMKTEISQKHHLMQQQSVGQRVGSHQPQMMSGISSPQLHKALSPQVTQHPSPQIDQQNILTSLSKSGTPLKSASSPFVVPSPSTPLASSPMTGDSEKVSAGLASNNIAGNIMHQQATLLMEFQPHTSTVECIQISPSELS
ncbi:hypothetical protein EJD97_009527 [Solanum chilense]|uniref:Uncharacterized protein n=1 Tax=Solanum chilense TaxID=4083 RepID=A0A6N2BI79_SOLCI|nr:hypothetical protein EJD97_009527 [Solanum chilense]